jgi:hydroxypyruvate isomerase
MCNGAEISLLDSFNDKQFTTLIKRYSEIIPLVAKAGYSNLMCFSGSKRGMSDEEGSVISSNALLQKTIGLSFFAANR